MKIKRNIRGKQNSHSKLFNKDVGISPYLYFLKFAENFFFHFDVRSRQKLTTNGTWSTSAIT